MTTSLPPVFDRRLAIKTAYLIFIDCILLALCSILLFSCKEEYHFEPPQLPPLEKTIFDEIEEDLLNNPPNNGNTEIREQALVTLDSIFEHYVRKEWNRDVYHFFLSMMVNVYFGIHDTVLVPTIWSTYNHGFIIKTPEIVIAFDIVFGHKKWPSHHDWQDNELISGIISSIDILFISHFHQDHYHDSVTEAVMANGGLVVYPLGEKQITGNVRISFGDSLNLLGLKIKAYEGSHSAPNAIYEVTTQNGLKIIHTGDNNSFYALPEVKNLDILLVNVWISGIRDAIKISSPTLTIPGHIQELGHRTPPTYEEALAVDDIPLPSEVLVMAWGERYILPESMLGL